MITQKGFKSPSMNIYQIPTFIKRNLSLQFLSYAFLLYLIPIFLVGRVAYQIAYYTIIEEAKQANIQIVADQNDYLDLQMRQLNNLATNIAGIETITNTFDDVKFKNIDSYNSLKTQAEIGTILNGYTNIDGLVSIEIFTMDGRHYHVGDTLDANTIDEVTKQKFLNSALAAPQPINWLGVEKNVNVKSNQKQVVATTMLLKKVDKTTFVQQPVALLVINTSLQELKKHFAEIDLGSDAYLVVVDNDNEIIYAPDETLWGGQLDNKTTQLLKENNYRPFTMKQQEKMLVTPQRSTLTGWTILSFVPYRIFAQKTVLIAITIAFSLLVCLVLLTIGLLIVNKSIIFPIKTITNCFRSLQTGEVNWNERLTVTQENEMGN